MPERDLPEWKVAHFRITGFATAPIDISKLDWWNQVTGVSSDQKIARPKDITYLEHGAFEEGILSLSIDVVRAEWKYEAKPIKEGEEFRIPVIGGIAQTLDVFTEISKRWLANASTPELRRIAFGSALIIDVKNREDGYETLNHFLKSTRIDAENSSDFLFQINRRRPSQRSSQNIYINRLMKWSVQLQVFQELRFSLPASGTATEMPKLEALGARLELDINTPAEFQEPLKKTETESVFLELVEFAKEIAFEGET